MAIIGRWGLIGPIREIRSHPHRLASLFFLHPLTCVSRYRTPCSTCCTISTFFICARDYSHGLVHRCVTREKGDGGYGPMVLCAQLALQGELRGVSGLASLSGPRTRCAATRSGGEECVRDRRGLCGHRTQGEEVTQGQVPQVCAYAQIVDAEPRPIWAHQVEAPNPRTVEAKRKAKWPPRGQTAERERVPEGEGELAALKSAAPWDLEGKMWHDEGEPAWEGLVEPQRAHLRSQNRGSPSPLKRMHPTHTKIESVWPGIDYNDAHAPSFPFPIALDYF
jgi:hypothetical protein